jgi:Ras-related protein Rab-5C
MRSSAVIAAITKKFVMLGAASTGKTSIVNRFAHNRAASHTESTIGAAFVSKVLKIGDSEVKLEIWDTGGSEKYRAIAPMYYRDCHAAIIVFDVTMASSLDDAQVWLEELREKGPAAAVVALAANKADLIGSRVIDQEKINEFLAVNDLYLFKETSALTGDNITELFGEVTEKLMEGQQMMAGGKTELEQKPESTGPDCC